MRKLPRIRLVTFADGNLAYRLAAKRLKKEAIAAGVFTDIQIYDRSRVLQEIATGDRQTADFIQSKNRGFGYWLWKPMILDFELQRETENFDFLLYLDVGCVININPESRAKLLDYCSLSVSNGALVFHMNGYIENQWTKQAALDYFESDSEMATSFQRLATVIMLPNSEFSKNLVGTWLEACNFEGHALLNDSLELKEIDTLRAHRHDQSLWSLATKALGVKSISDETYHHPNWQSEGKNYPLWAARIVGFRKPQASQSFAAKVLFRLLKTIP